MDISKLTPPNIAGTDLQKRIQHLCKVLHIDRLAVKLIHPQDLLGEEFAFKGVFKFSNFQSVTHTPTPLGEQEIRGAGLVLGNNVFFHLEHYKDAGQGKPGTFPGHMLVLPLKLLSGHPWGQAKVHPLKDALDWPAARAEEPWKKILTGRVHQVESGLEVRSTLTGEEVACLNISRMVHTQNNRQFHVIGGTELFTDPTRDALYRFKHWVQQEALSKRARQHRAGQKTQSMGRKL